MEPRFTRGEYWLLETVVVREFEVCALNWSDLELYLNKRGHGLTRKSLVETLHRLLSSGLIYAKSKAGGFISTDEEIKLALDSPLPWRTHSVFISTDGQIEVTDEPRPAGTYPVDWRTVTHYGLTQEGGAQWEAFAAPNWQKYVHTRSQVSDESEYEDESGCELWELVCADKEWLERYIEALCYRKHNEVILDTVVWDYIAPWQATYWKQLDGGHRIRFQSRVKTELDSGQPPSLEYFFRGWYAWG